VKTFLDSSVLVATFYGGHEHYDLSFALFLRLNKRNGYTAAHCLSEVYSTLTGMPGKDRASPDEALLFLTNVRERLTLVDSMRRNIHECWKTQRSPESPGAASMKRLSDAVL